MAGVNPDYTMPNQYQRMDDLARDGVEPWEYALFRAALAMQDDTNADTEKRNGSYDTDEVQAAIASMSGLSQDEKWMLFDAVSTAKSNPYK